MRETRKISKNAGFRNRGTFTIAPKKLVEPELYAGKSIDKSNYVTKSPIQHDFTPVKPETRTRNVGRNDHRGLSSLSALLNQEATLKKLNSERKLSRGSSTFNSSVMRQCMDLKGANPQGADSAAPQKKKLDRSKYLTNNLPKAVQMQSM